MTLPSSTLLAPGYLHTQGSQIVDANGNDVRIDAIAWAGMDSSTNTLIGLAWFSYQSMMNGMLAAGFNTIRIPWSDININGVPAAGAVNTTLNPSLAGLNTLQILDKIIAYAGQIGMKVILDHHNDNGGTNGQGGQQANGLWYNSGPGSDNSGTVTAAQFQADTVALATRYAGNSTVIGFDLDNEPLGPAAQWGGGGPTDLRQMYINVGDAVQAVDPGALIIAEGPQTYAPQANLPVAAPEGNLEGVATLPVTLTIPNQLVYSVHEYPASVNPANFNGNAAAYIQQMNTAWGYVESQGIAPVWIGEMGSSDLSSPSDALWASTITAYLNGQDGASGGPTFAAGQQPVSTDYWDWAYYGGSGTPNGILESNWTTPEPDQLALAQKFEPLTSATSSGGGSSGGGSSGGNSGTVTIGSGTANATISTSNTQIVITAGSGNHNVTITGTMDTLIATNGNQTITANPGINTITTGSGNDTITFAGTGNVINAGGGTNWLVDDGQSSTLVIPAANAGNDTIYGSELSNGDTFDLRSALAATNWNGASSALSQYLHLSSKGGVETLSISSKANGSSAAVAQFENTGSFSLTTFLAHALT